jgi:hypothetical protein
MAKTYDGGIATGPLNMLLDRMKDLQRALDGLGAALVVEEHQASLVDQDKVAEQDGKCAAITTKRREMTDLIGSPVAGLIKALGACTLAVVEFTNEVETFSGIYEGVTTEPTGEAGHC